MNIEEFKAYLESNYAFSTLNDCSKDTANSTHLVDNRTVKVFNFDEIKDKEIKETCFPKNVSLTSPDTLFFDRNNQIKLIEFKNTFIGDIYKPAVRAKCYEALILLKSRFGLQNYEDITYILVHNGPKKKSKSTARLLEGRCPPELGILKHEFPYLKVESYNASYFNTRFNHILSVDTTR